PLNLALRSTGGTAGTGHKRLWGRKLVVALQISLCMVLLCSAGLLYRTLRNLESSDLGMRTAGLFVFGISPQSNIHTDADAVSSPKVAIVNQSFADRYLPGVHPLQHHIALLGDSKVEYSIVGVAGNSRYTGIRETERPMAYVPFTQTQGVLDMQYELHTRGDPRMVGPEAAKVVHEFDPNLPLQKPVTQQAQFAESVSQERLVANLSVFFGGLAAFLVAIGIYGTISFGINRRTREIGVRMALGAQREEVLRMVLLESLSVAAVGLAVGIPVSLAVARTLRSMLYGLSSSDPLTIVVAFAGIAVVTLAAAFFPAHRAASIDPMRALR